MDNAKIAGIRRELRSTESLLENRQNELMEAFVQKRISLKEYTEAYQHCHRTYADTKNKLSNRISRLSVNELLHLRRLGVNLGNYYYGL